MKRVSPNQVPIEGVHVAEIKDEAVTFGNGAIIPTIGRNELK
jgi:hypothetical protein